MSPEEKKIKRQNIIIVILSVIAVSLLALSVISLLKGNLAKKEENTSTAQTTQVTSADVNNNKKVVSSIVEKQPECTNREMLGLMQDTFKEEFKVDFYPEENAYAFMPYEENIVTSIFATMTGATSPDDWNSLADAMATVSKAIAEKTDNESVEIHILNPLDPDKSILIVSNGLIKYNVMDKQ